MLTQWKPPVIKFKPAVHPYTWTTDSGTQERICTPFHTTELTFHGQVVKVWYEHVGQGNLAWRAILLDEQNEGMLIISVLDNHAMSSSAISRKGRRRTFWKGLQAYIFANCRDMAFLYPR